MQQEPKFTFRGFLWIALFFSFLTGGLKDNQAAKDLFFLFGPVVVVLALIIFLMIIVMKNMETISAWLIVVFRFRWLRKEIENH